MISNFTIVSNNLVDTALAKENDTVTVMVTTIRAIRSPTFAVSGISDERLKYQDAKDGREWLATFVVMEADDSGPDNVNVSVAVEDLAGNRAFMDSTTGGTSVRVGKWSVSAPSFFACFERHLISTSSVPPSPVPLSLPPPPSLSHRHDGPQSGRHHSFHQS